MRYEAGANGYRILPITEEEFAIMTTMAASRPKTQNSVSRHHYPQPHPITEEEFAIMTRAASRPKTRETKKIVSASKHHHPQPQTIFPKSKVENRSLSMSRAEESLHPKSTFPAINMESSKKEHRLPNLPVSKEEGGASSSRRKSNSLEEIVPAFLRPKVRIYQNCRLY